MPILAWRNTVALAAAGAALAGPAFVTPAHAQPAPTPATAFTAQVEHAGLSRSQATSLQQEVQRYLDQLGGTQVSANRIDWLDGHMLVAVPGEKLARDLRTGEVASGINDCDYKNFCGWKGANFTGSFWERESCTYHEIPDGWNSGGFWWNYQTPGTVARMYGKSYNLVYQTKPASRDYEVFDQHGNWGPVWYVKPC